MSSFKTLLISILSAVIGLSSCIAKSEKPTTDSSSHSEAIVCYFSATGTTAQAAKRIAALTGADLYEITPEVRYTDADLDWRDSLSRSYVEMHNRSFRPAIIDSIPDMNKYDVVFIGYPNWWNTHPTIINTFIEANDFNGKILIPFMTSGGSNITNSEKELKETYPDLTFVEGFLMNNVSEEEIVIWIKKVRR